MDSRTRSVNATTALAAESSLAPACHFTINWRTFSAFKVWQARDFGWCLEHRDRLRTLRVSGQKTASVYTSRAEVFGLGVQRSGNRVRDNNCGVTDSPWQMNTVVRRYLVYERHQSPGGDESFPFENARLAARGALDFSVRLCCETGRRLRFRLLGYG